MDSHRKKEKQFKCSFCNKKFIDNSRLKQHHRSHNKYLRTSNEKFKASSSRTPHVRSQTTQGSSTTDHQSVREENAYKRQLHEEMFITNNQLESHMQNYNERNLNENKESGFSHGDNSRQHIRELHKCNVCHKQFETNIHLNRHVKIHFSQCEHCGKRFELRKALLAHISSHKRSNIGPDHVYECNVCNEVLPNSRTHKEHLRNHFQKDFYENKVYEQKFNTERNLNSDYIRVDTAEMPYECQLCKLRFRESGDIIQHLQHLHRMKPYACEVCKQNFRSKGRCKKHYRAHTEDQQNVKFETKN